MKNQNSEAIIILCSHLCVGKDVKPFEPSEWSKLADKLIVNNLTPMDLVNMNIEELNKYFSSEEAERILRLVERSTSLFFEVNKLRESGVEIVTRADSRYPKILKRKLKKSCPPLFYYIGDLEICNKKAIGIVGSRNIDEDDEKFTRDLVKKINDNGYAIVSGGARGIDSVSVEASLKNNCYGIEYVADSLLKKIRKKDTIDAIRKGKLLILSASKPDAGFNVGMAMGRNKFIYAQSEATIAIKSDYKKGGTWTGAIDALKKGYCTVLCRYNPNSKGNIGLIDNGAIAIDENWNCEFEKQSLKEIEKDKLDEVKKEEKPKNDINSQMSLFGK